MGKLLLLSFSHRLYNAVQANIFTREEGANMNDLTDFIQQVKRANDIVDVVGSYLELRHSGTNFFARCPFHGEKTGSFSVNRNMQIFKCFGCGESGDVVKFVQMYESVSFMEALEILAKRANIPMPQTAKQAQDDQYQQRKKKRDVYLAICKDTAIFYYKAYASSLGRRAREYMEGRGFDSKTITKFGIGYSPDDVSLITYLHQRGYNDEDIVKCGVAYKNKQGQVVDSLRGRLIIPIFNMQGKVIAFGGRALDEYTAQYGKYKNTSETPLFKKNDNLFALNIAKEQKQQTALPNIVVVEGYMDVLSMYQAGFKRAVASMGTSLTENQAKWISRLTETVYICYDGDAAGQQATVRGMDLLDQAGLDVKVMSVPDSLDPDEYIKKHGADAFEGLIAKALPLPDYKLHLLDKAFDIHSTNSAKRNEALAKYVKGAIKMLKALDDIRQNQYITVVSAKTGYSQDYLRRKLLEDFTEGTTQQTDTAVDTQSPHTMAKYFVAACILHGEDYATISQKPICDTLFLDRLYDYIFDCYQGGQSPTVDMLYTVCPDASERDYSQIIDVDFSKKRYEKNRAYFSECLSLIKAESLQAQRTSLLAEVKQHPDDMQLLQQLAEITRQINNLR